MNELHSFEPYDSDEDDSNYCRICDKYQFDERFHTTAHRGVAEGWRDIASVPIDGTAILVSCNHQVQLVRWMVSEAKGAPDGWWFVGGYDGHLLGFAPNYWQPLPSPPERVAESSRRGEG